MPRADDRATLPLHAGRHAAPAEPCRKLPRSFTPSPTARRACAFRWLSIGYQLTVVAKDSLIRALSGQRQRIPDIRWEYPRTGILRQQGCTTAQRIRLD